MHKMRDSLTVKVNYWDMDKYAVQIRIANFNLLIIYEYKYD